MSFEDYESFSFETVWKVVLIIRIIILNVKSPQRTFQRTLYVHIIANVLVDVVLVLKDFVWARRPQESFFDCLFMAHFFVVVIATNLFDLKLQFWQAFE